MLKRIKKILNEFKEFSTKGDAIALAVGVILGNSFKGIIDSLVNDIIMPPIGYITAKIDFTDLYIALGSNKYDNIKKAQEAGAVVISYGKFLNQLIIFLVTSFVLFIFVYKLIQFIQKRDENKKVKEVKKTKTCPYCYMDINKKATKCPYCVSNIK